MYNTQLKKDDRKLVCLQLISHPLLRPPPLSPGCFCWWPPPPSSPRVHCLSHGGCLALGSRILIQCPLCLSPVGQHGNFTYAAFSTVTVVHILYIDELAVGNIPMVMISYTSIKEHALR